MISAMHVGKFFPPFAGGMENFLADLLRGLSDQGVRGAAVVHNHRSLGRGEVVDWAPPDGQTGAVGAEAAGAVRLYRVPMLGRSLYSPVSPQFPVWMRRAIRRERPDILHMHLPNTSAFWVFLIPEARRIPWVVHWHADVVPSELDRRLKLAYPMYRPFEQKLLREARRVIVTSPPYLHHSQALAPWRDKCRVVPLGLDPSRIPSVSAQARVEAQKSWGDAGFRILSVGRLTYYKGHEYLVGALKDVPGARALIVGEGERRRLLEKAISELKIDDRVVLAGCVPPERLHALMESCDCVCLPSIERTEAFGVVLLEAMAHGKPTVVCDINGSGVSWVVQDGITGRVVAPANLAALSEALRALSVDRGALSRMGTEGRHRYQRKFRIDRVASEILELYGQILRTRTAR